MMKIVVNGASGRMGRELVLCAQNGYRGACLSAAVDVTRPEADCPTYTTLDAVCEECDVLVDFSHHSATKSVLDFALLRGIPVVIATTGQTEEEQQMIQQAAKHIPVFFAGNMSIGIALLVSLVKTAVSTFPDADVEIIETHHNQKLDVPSGTALLLAHRMQEVLTDSVLLVGRHENGKRTAKEIGIHSLRMGNHAGSHTVCFGSNEQTLTLTHTAHSPRIYAVGAIRAAEFLLTQKPGLYGMPQLLSHLHIL